MNVSEVIEAPLDSGYFLRFGCVGINFYFPKLVTIENRGHNCPDRQMRRQFL